MPLPTWYHCRLHETLPEIPVPDEDACQKVCLIVEDYLIKRDIVLYDRPSTRLDVLISALDTVDGDADKTILALELQRAYLAQGGL